MGEDHEDDVQNPDDVPTEDQTDEGAYPMAFLKAGHKPKDPWGDGNDAKD